MILASSARIRSRTRRSIKHLHTGSRRREPIRPKIRDRSEAQSRCSRIQRRCSWCGGSAPARRNMVHHHVYDRRCRGRRVYPMLRIHFDARTYESRGSGSHVGPSLLHRALALHRVSVLGNRAISSESWRTLLRVPISACCHAHMAAVSMITDAAFAGSWTRLSAWSTLRSCSESEHRVTSAFRRSARQRSRTWCRMPLSRLPRNAGWHPAHSEPGGPPRSLDPPACRRVGH